MSMPGGFVDLHSHLVPGVDDGARTPDDVLDGVRRMVDVGITRIVTTPHLDGALTNETELLEDRLGEVDAAFEEVESLVGAELPDIDFVRGHEVMMNVPDPDLSDPRLRLGGGPYVLIEWPRLQIPPRTEEVIETIVQAGYRPLIAHPERYFGMLEEMELARSWRRAGAILQVNNGSFVGRYGKDAQQVAVRLLCAGLVDCLSSDFHGRSHLKLYVKEARVWFEERDGAEQFYLLTATNPGRILDGEDTLAVTPLRVEEGFWKKVRGMLGNG